MFGKKKRPEHRPLSLREQKRRVAAMRRARDRQYELAVTDSYDAEKKKRIRLLLLTACALLAIVLCSCIVSLSRAAAGIHPWLGYAVCVLLILLTIFCAAIPLLRLLVLKPLSVRADASQAPVATRRNMYILRRAAKNIIRYHNGRKSGRYVTPERIGELQRLLRGSSRVAFLDYMGDLYRNEISKQAVEVTRTACLRCFITTAVSQNDKIDFLSTMFINISMVKQIVFTYGFRPTTSSLLKIFWTALKNSITALCLENMSVYSALTNKLLKGALDWVPLLDTVVDSAFQGATNALLTSLMGRKTRRLLFGEFEDAVDLNNNCIDDDLEAAVAEIALLKQQKKEAERARKRENASVGSQEPSVP